VNLIGLMLARNESWVIGCSLRAALKWCDKVVVIDHASTDDTGKIILDAAFEYDGRVILHRWSDTEQWDEMFVRQKSLEVGRAAGGTHFAIVDCDEVLTANIIPKIREEFEWLYEGQCIEVPMLAMRDLDHYQDDDTVWSRAWLTLGFRDKESLSWKPQEDGYHFHSRPPHGVMSHRRRYLTDKRDGGAMHLQWCNQRRIKAKHAHYAATEWIRWPNHRGKVGINETYAMALQPPDKVSEVSPYWWLGLERNLIQTDGVPWHEADLQRLIAKHGREFFDGIDLKGY
jgi:hypothetical protein